jgi:hypothetical protein
MRTHTRMYSNMCVCVCVCVRARYCRQPIRRPIVLFSPAEWGGAHTFMRVHTLTHVRMYTCVCVSLCKYRKGGRDSFYFSQHRSPLYMYYAYRRCRRPRRVHIKYVVVPPTYKCIIYGDIRNNN